MFLSEFCRILIIFNVIKRMCFVVFNICFKACIWKINQLISKHYYTKMYAYLFYTKASNKSNKKQHLPGSVVLKLNINQLNFRRFQKNLKVY